MPLDAICLGAVTNELNTVLTGCRIEKVYQPDRDEIVIQTRGQGGARRLLVSIASCRSADVLHVAAQAWAGSKNRRSNAACGRTNAEHRARYNR